MAKTINTFVGDGIATVYTPAFDSGYISQDHVYVYLDGNDYTNQLSYSWVGNQIVLDTPVSDQTIFYIRRVVPRGDPINDYTNGARLGQQNLDDSYRQALHLLEEVEDGFITLEDAFALRSDLDMTDHQIKNLADPTDDTDATNKQYVASEDDNHLQEAKDYTDQQIANIPSGGGGSGTPVYTSVANMVAASGSLTTGQVVRTLGYNSVGDLGHGWYRIEVGTPTTYLNPDMGGGRVATLLHDGEIFIEQAGCGSGVDNLNQMIELLSTELKVRARSINTEFPMSDVVFLFNKSIDIDMGSNNTFVSTGANERVFLFKNELDATIAASDVSSSGGRTTITVPAGHGIEAWDAIKLFSNQTINPYSEFPNQRAAEYFIVESVTSTTITCVGRRIFDHDQADNPRIAKMDTSKKLKMKNLKVTKYNATVPGEFAVAFEVQGYFDGQIENVSSPYWVGQLMTVRSCYRTTLRNIRADKLLDVTSENKLGYVGVDYGSQESKWYQLDGGVVRHTYTTGSNSISANDSNSINYGGAVRCHVYSGVTVGCTNFAYDTHQDAWECEFHDLTVYEAQSNTVASSGGFQDRAQNNIVHKLTYISNGTESSANGRAIFYNTGAYNTLVKHLIYNCRSGTAVSSFGVDFTSARPKFRIDTIDMFIDKYLGDCVQMFEDYQLEIGTVNIRQFNPERGYYGAGGSALFKLSGDGKLHIGECNLFMDNSKTPNVSGGDYFVRYDGTFESFKCTLNVYCTKNTSRWVNGSYSTFRTNNDTLYNIGRSHIDIIVYFDEWDGAAGFERVANIFDDTTTGERTYTYKIIKEGKIVSSAHKNLKDTAFDATTKIVFGDRSQFGLTSGEGAVVNDELICMYQGHSASAAFDSIDAPTVEGQTIDLYVTPTSDLVSPPAQAITLLAANPNIRLASDYVIPVGGRVKLVAVTRESDLLWDVYT